MNNITMKDVIAFVHKAMDLNYRVKHLNGIINTINIYKNEKFLMDFSFYSDNTLRIITPNGDIEFSVSEAEANLYRVLGDEVKEYAENRAIEDFNNFITDDENID